MKSDEIHRLTPSFFPGFIQILDHWRPSLQQDISWRQYWRDDRDRITAFQKSYNPGSNPLENGRGDRFHYDDEGQLLEGWYDAVDPANSGAGNTRYDGFSYDALGNRGLGNYVANRGAMDFVRDNNGLNQYQAWWPYSSTNYDDDIGGTWGAPGAANGVLMQEGNITAGYNALNQPMMIQGPAQAGTNIWVWFGFDPLGRCVKRWMSDSGDVYSNPATYLHYDGWNMLQEGNNAWGPSRVYAHGSRVDEVVWSYNTFTGEQAFHHYDARGHCTLLTDSLGGILEQYEYDAFGRPYFYDAAGTSIGSYDSFGIWQGYSLVGNRFLFTGREWLGDLKLYDYRARMYQPELGRFLQPDPKQFAAGDYNLYRYCHNDPVNKSDPTGLTFVVQADQRKLWNDVKEYLRRDPAQRKIIDRLDKPDVKVRINIVKDKVSGAVFDPKVGVRWNPYSAVKSRESGARLSPVLILGHELDHIYQGVFNQEAYKDDRNRDDSQYQNREERRVITGSEASMLRTFFNEGPRPDYKIEPYEVSDPFKR